MDAKALINAMVAQMAIFPEIKSFDLLAHAVSVERDLNKWDSEEWLAEEIQDRLVAMAD